jgi:Co/Zn/Cd efflux system component
LKVSNHAIDSFLKANTMSAHCHSHDHAPTAEQSSSSRYKRILWIALLVNLAMFGVEVFAGALSGSVSLLADAIDFLGDAFNYGLSLSVLGMAIAWRSRAAVFKGLCMLVFGVAVLAKAAWALQYGAAPQAATMGMVGTLALVANASVAAMLYAYREGDANMRSVWLCTRNDAIGNVAVLLAALGVFGTGSAWPDLLVAGVMASLALVGGWSVLKQALRELHWDEGKTQ